MQLAEVELVWNMPAPQLTHEPAAAPAYWPEGQLVQLVAPVVAMKEPVEQLTQVDELEAPTVVEYMPALQPWQVAKELAPTTVE
jgi:hypothetical protein